MITRSSSQPKSEAGSSTTRQKIKDPAKAFSDPMQVVNDATLSTQEKLLVLNAMEQDARQLAVASAEGMEGGEETKLHNVLQAKRCLEWPSADAAFTVVAQTFDDELRETVGTETHATIARAIDAVKAARQAILDRAKSSALPPGVPAPGSAEEIQEEINKEKLDPGA